MRPAGWALLAALLALAPLRGDDPKDPKKDPPKTEEKKPAVRTETIVGKVVQVESQKQTIKVDCDPRTSRPNPLIVQAIKTAEASVRDTYKIRNPQERQAALKEIDDKIKDYRKNLYVYTIDAGTDHKVRLPHPKEMFDDMGNIKKLTPKARAELMGKDHLFDGEWADLRMGQVVSVTYVAPPPPKKGKPDELGAAADGNLQATKVAVVQDVPETPTGPKKR